VVNIHLPPLRERKEDLIDLIKVLIGRINKELHRNVSHISRSTLDALGQYDWPGNVRELENILMKSIALSRGDTLSDDLLPAQLLQHESTTDDESKPLEDYSLEEIEATHIARVLEATNWHKGKACETLGISRPRLRRMIKHYNLATPEQFKNTGNDEDEGTTPA